MDFQLNTKKKITVGIGGESYELTKLTVGELRKLGSDSFAKLSRGEEDPLGALDASCKLLSSMGLPEEVVDSLDSEELTALMNFLSGSKKN